MEEIVINKIDQSIIIYFNLLEDWESFEIILEKLKIHFAAEVTSRIEMPDSKFCKISIDEAHLTLINDPYGNSLRADNKKADEIIYNIYNKWNNYSSLR